MLTLGNQFRALLAATLISLISGCTDIEEDRTALKTSCSIAQSSCLAGCFGSRECTDACTNGFDACLTHVNSEEPSDWQPPDAFFDACSTQCNEDDNCPEACSRGQNSAACDSGKLLEKYGTISTCF